MTITIDTEQEARRLISQKAITDPYHNGKHDKKRREIIHLAPKNQTEQDLYLSLQDTAYDWNCLFLGRSKTFEKDHSPERYNVVVPIVPRCYTTTNRDPAYAELPPEGWIYIIRRRMSTKGRMMVELWRELKSDGKGFFRDVHLEKIKELEEKDHREATGKPGFRIIVPYCIDKEVHDLWIAFSEVQWSWARIQRMKRSATLRARRMHKLDLSDCLNDFKNCDYKGPSNPSQTAGPRIKKIIKDISGPALIYNLKTAPDTFSRQLTDDLKDPIPVVYLDNPVGIAKNLGKIYQKACEDMRNYVKLLESAPGILQRDPAQRGSTKMTPKQKKLLKELEAKPYDPVRWSDSAKILNRYLYTDFPDNPPKDWTEKQKADFPNLKAEAEKKFLAYRTKIDKVDLDRALGTARRKVLRRNIEITKGWLTDFLHHELVTLGKDSALLQALDDHFTLSVLKKGTHPVTITKNNGQKVTTWPDNYADGWKTVTGIIHYLGKHLYAHDEDLIAPAPDGWELRKKDAGIKLLEKIADPQAGLLIHKRLFPTAKEGHPPTVIDRETKVEDCDPNFKHEHFDSLIGGQLGRCADIAKDFAREFEEVVAMDDRTDRAYKQLIERVQHSIIRLVNGVLQTDGSPFKVPIPDILDFKKELQKDFQALRRPVLFFSHAGDMVFEVVNEALDEKANWNGRANVDFRTRRGVSGLSAPQGSKYKVKHATLKRTPTAHNPSNLKVTTGLGDELTLKPKFSGPKNTKAKVRNYEATVFLELSDDTRNRLLNRIGTNEGCMKALGGLVAVVETINLVNSFQAIANNKNADLRGELIADLISSFGDLAGAMKDLIDDRGKSKAVTTTRGGPKIGLRANTAAEQARLTKIIRFLEIMGHVGSAIDIGLTLKSLIENFRQNDDAYIGDAVMLTGFILTALGGTAAAAPLAALVGLSAAWVTGIGLLLLLIGYLIKRFVFPEDTSFKIWLVNGPFACGKRSHTCFQYQRIAQVIHLKDKDGRTVPTACTMHIFDNDWLAVDSSGKLVEVSPYDPNGLNFRFRRDNKGQVYLNAGRYGGGKNPLVVTQDTPIGTIGKPYSPHPLLQTKTAPSDERFDGHTPGEDPEQYLYKFSTARTLISPSMEAGRFLGAFISGDKKRYRLAIWCERPKEAYDALMDALFRPVVTFQNTQLTVGEHFVSLDIHTPFLLPNSQLYIQGQIEVVCRSANGKEITKPRIIVDIDPANQDYQTTLDNLKNGPNCFSIHFSHVTAFRYNLKVRIELSGDHETYLPCEPLFCGSDVSTGPEKHLWVEFKRTFPEDLTAIKNVGTSIRLSEACLSGLLEH